MRSPWIAIVASDEVPKASMQRAQTLVAPTLGQVREDAVAARPASRPGSVQAWSAFSSVT